MGGSLVIPRLRVGKNKNLVELLEWGSIVGYSSGRCVGKRNSARVGNSAGRGMKNIIKKKNNRDLSFHGCCGYTHGVWILDKFCHNPGWKSRLSLFSLFYFPEQ